MITSRLLFKPKLTIAESAYIAGILDGEGSISIVRMKRGSKTHCSFALLMHITNTDLALLEWIKQKLGGHIYGASGTNRPCWRWQSSHKALNGAILEILRPYMRVKTKQADLAMAFIRLESIPHWNQRAGMYVAMKSLNGSNRPVRLEPPIYH